MTSPDLSPSFSSPRNFPQFYESFPTPVYSHSSHTPTSVVSPPFSDVLPSDPYTPWSYPLSPTVTREPPTAAGFRSIHFRDVGVLHYHSGVHIRLSSDSNPPVYLNPVPLDHNQLISRLQDLVVSSESRVPEADLSSSESE